MADGAIFHLDVSTISRSQGRSAVAAAAYRAGSKLLDAKTGLEHDYRRKKGVEDCFIAAPDGCDWITDRKTLWDACEAAENRKNSTVAREWLVALPEALDAQQRTELTHALAAELVTRYGIAVDVAIHAPNRKGDKRNHHAHLLTSTREAGPDGLGAKTRILDAAKTGGVEIAAVRKWWAGTVNDALQAADSTARIDHRRKSVIAAEMQAEAEVLRQQAAEIEAMHSSVKDAGGFTKGMGQALKALKNSGGTAMITKASEVPKLRERASELEHKAFDLAETPLNSHDGPQLTAYKRRMSDARAAQAKVEADLVASQKAEQERQRAEKAARDLQAQKDREAALRVAQEAAERKEHAERYAASTTPLVKRARENSNFARRVAQWGIDLNRSDHDTARDPIWGRRGKGYAGQLVWSILKDEAAEIDARAQHRAKVEREKNVKEFMQAQIKRAESFPTQKQKWQYEHFAALDPDNIQMAFNIKYRLKLTADEVTQTIRNMTERWIEKIVEDLSSLRQSSQSIWLTLTGNNSDAAQALETSLTQHRDLRSPIDAALKTLEPTEELSKPKSTRPKIDYGGPSGP